MNKKNIEIFKIGQKIGLNKKDIKNILTNTSPTNRLTSQSFGLGPDDPPYYEKSYIYK